jgi:hypothetical protein
VQRLVHRAAEFSVGIAFPFLFGFSRGDAP